MITVDKAPKEGAQHSTDPRAVAAIPIGLIDPSPTNPREIFDQEELAELAQSIRDRGGLLHAIRVRPKGERYEIICGERRWRAHLILDWPTVDCIVTERSDFDVLKDQAAENKDRVDVHPLEQLKAYEQILAAGTYGAGTAAKQALADELGVSRSKLYATLKLRDLCPEARAAFLSKPGFDEGIAFELARLRTEDQLKVLGDAGRMTVRGFADHVKRSIHLELELAPFSRKDGELCEIAGACTSCPKRSSYGLEASSPTSDRCLDRDCYLNKCALFVAAKIAEFEREGTEFVLISPEYWKKGDYLGYPYWGSQAYDVVKSGGVAAIYIESNYAHRLGEMTRVSLKGEATQVKKDPEFEAKVAVWKADKETAEKKIRKDFNSILINEVVTLRGDRTRSKTAALSALIGCCSQGDYYYLAELLNWPKPKSNYASSTESLPIALKAFEEKGDADLVDVILLAPIAKELYYLESWADLPRLQALAKALGHDVDKILRDVEAANPIPKRPVKPKERA